MLSFDPINTVRCELGEGPTYDAARNTLWYIDIVAGRIHSFALETGAARHYDLGSTVCSLGLARSGRLVVSLTHVVGLFDPDTGDFTEIAQIEVDRGTDTRLNDGKVGPDGAFWVGSMDDRGLPTREPLGSLYRVQPDGTVETKVEGIKVSNGLAWSGDGKTMFHSDSSGPWIDRWDFDPATGAISNRTRIATLDDAAGRPDGGATDIEGCYWSAGVSTSKLNRFDRDGKLVATYDVPVAAPTMPCFGGADLRTLFLTSLRRGRSAALLEQFPLTGTTVMARSPVAGTPVALFAD